MNNSRIIENINLDWKFLRGDEAKAWYKGLDDSMWRSVTLPHDWSVEEPFSKEHSSGTGYLPGGLAWYRKTFSLPKELEGKRIYITFEGVYNNSQVWCNSYYIGKRPYGYSTFTYDITDFATFGDVKNVISVKVNHKDIADSRWFTGSGIYRDVYITVTDNIHIDKYGVFISTPEVSRVQASVKVNVNILNETEADAEIQIKNIFFSNNNEKIEEVVEVKTINAGAKLNIDQTITAPNPKLWSPDSPNLYYVLTEVIKEGKVIDHVKTSVGIRWFRFDANKGFFLNDINMKIKGVCVHHDAGCLGAAVPDKVWIRRLEELKEMGCNAIRMSHNPPSSNLLDLCDKMGFLVMDEAFDEWEGVKNKWATGHNVYPPKHFGYYEDFPEWGEIDIKEMVLRDRNHPSIILWSIGNEVDYPNDPYCHPYFATMTGNNDANKPVEERAYDPNKPNAERLTTIARRLVKYVKECDITRPVTSALAFPELSNLTGYAEALDVIGYNYKEHLYEEDYIKYENRVIYGSENSSSLEAWLAVRDKEYICGQFIWTGIDYLGEAHGWPIRAAQPGFLDLAGFKKPKYYYRQSLWSEKPMVYLSVMPKEDSYQDQSYKWNGGEAHWNLKAGEQVEVICYTNCEEAELFLNNRSLGTKKLKDFKEYYLTWSVAFEEGTLKVVGKNSDGRAYNCELCSASKAKKLIMIAKDTELIANGQDIAHIEIQVMDSNDNLVYLADNEIKLTIEGAGEILGMENGNAQDLEAYSSRKRKPYHGKLISYIRTKTQEGQISVKAEADGLEPAQIIIKVK
jgi:hypothetical protein